MLFEGKKGDNMADGYLNFDTKINEKGFNEGISKLNSLAGKGLSIVNKSITGAVAVIGAGTTAIIKSSLGVVANMEQQVGGVETLFKDSAKTVLRNANNAFKTAQLSANDYMSTVTSFSASLLQGLGGDTAKAAEIADMALIDMADNANKMGTNMQDIQNAYQGFAKQNYTMLDNLKLGYGGTQSEMIRLINDSGILNEKIEDLDNVTFDQMIQAIHKVQQNLGITGTSAKEASTTIEGSVNSAKAAWENFEAGAISANDLVDTFWTAAKNILNNLGQMIPRLGKTGMDVVESLSGKIGEVIPQLKGLTDSVGKFADKLKNMSTDELMSLGKALAVLAGTAPALKILGKNASALSDVLGSTSGDAISKLNKLPASIKDLGKSMKSNAKIFGNVKDVILLPFEDLSPKITGILQKATNAIKTGTIGKTASETADVFKGIAKTIITPFENIGPTLSKTFPKIAIALKNCGNTVRDTFGIIGEGAKGFGSLMGGAFSSVLTEVSAFGGKLTSYLGLVGESFTPLLSKVAGLIPSFVGLLNFGIVAAVVVAGLGLVYNQFGEQIDQILLMAQTKGPEVITNFANGITEALPGLIGSGVALITKLLETITANLPALISAGIGIVTTLVSSLASQLPALIPVAVDMILTLIESLLDNLPQLVSSGLELMEGLAQGIANAIPKVAEKAPIIIGKLASTIITNLPKILQTGVKIITQLAVGLVQGIPSLLGKIPSMISQIKNAFTSVNWGQVGLNIIKGIASGIAGAAGRLVDAAVKAATDALNWVKKKLGIHSPSTVFRDQVGKNMALGVGVGFEKNIPSKDMSAKLQYAVEGLKKDVVISTSLQTNQVLGGINYVSGFDKDTRTVSSDNPKPREIIIHTHVDLDGKEVGNSVTKYVDQNMSDDEDLRRRGN